MSRTTLDIASPVLKELRELQKAERQSLGSLVSQLLAEALAQRRRGRSGSRPAFRWVSRPMKARVDLSDKEAVYAILDADESRRR